MRKTISIYGLVLCLLFMTDIEAQTTLDLPNVSQRASVTQRIGLTDITVIYHRPQVKGRQIWGGIVPFDMSAGFPWRAGANQNTVIEFSNDVKVESKDLKTGKYGLHIIAHQDETATVIFSKNSSSWGSFYYNQAEDALRVKVAMKEIPHREWMAYEFDELEADNATLALIWGKKAIPFKIETNAPAIAIASIKDQLRGVNGVFWQNYVAASNYAVGVDEKEQALAWATTATSNSANNPNAVLNEANILFSLNRDAEADKIMSNLVSSKDATALIIYRYGRKLIDRGRAKEALDMYQENLVKRFPDDWLTSLGLGRAYSKMGDYKTALKFVSRSIDAYKKLDGWSQVQLSGLQGYVDSLRANKDIN